MNTGGFISAVTFYSDIFTKKPSVPAEMTFWLGGTSQGLDDVNNRVYNLEEILQIGYISMDLIVRCQHHYQIIVHRMKCGDWGMALVIEKKSWF